MLSSIFALPATAGATGRLSGVVEDETGKPFAAAQVRVVDGAGSTVANVTSDTHGRYTADLPAATYRLEIEAQDHGQPLRARIAAVDVADDTPLDIVVAGGPSRVSHFDGTVTDPTGKPIPSATVRIDNEGSTSTVTDAGGNFRIDVETGTHVLNIDGPSPYSGYNDNAFDLTHDRHEQFTLSPTGTTALMAASVAGGGPSPAAARTAAFEEHTVSGTVLSPGGSPLEGVQVALGSISYSTAATGPDGRYSLSGNAGAGANTLNVRWSLGSPDDEYCWPDRNCEYEDYTLAVNGFHPETAPQSLDFRLPPATFTLRVVDSAGRPVEGAVVTADSTAAPDSPGGELFPGGPVSGAIQSRHLTAADGTASMPMIPGRAPALQVDPPSDRGLPAGLTPAKDATSAEVRVPGGVMVRGSIKSTTGQPGRFLNAGFVSPDGKFRREFTVSADRLSYGVIVPAGRYWFWTDTNDNEPGGESDDHWYYDVQSTQFDVTGDTTINFTIPALADAHLSFVDSRGLPIEGDLDIVATTGADAVELAPHIRGTATASLYIFGATESAGFSIPGVSTVSARFETGAPLTLSGLAVGPGRRIAVALAEGSDFAPPDEPTDMHAEQTGPGTVTIRWAAPADDHGSAITGYLAAAQTWGGPGRISTTTTATTAVISGLTPGRKYGLSVRATTRRGTGNGAYADLTLDNSQPPAGDPDGSAADPPSQAQPPATSAEARHAGYWALSSDGRVYSFGAAPALGQTGAGAVDLEPTPTGKGYWTLSRSGQIQAFGDASPLGAVDKTKLAKDEQPASLSATPSGKGYWVFTNRGRAIAFGDAPFLGDMSATKLNGPVLGSVATPTGKGYYMVASDGGIFAFGDARFAGSMGGKKLNAPVQSLVPDADGNGYWLVASDGGIFAFDAPFRGSMGATKLNKPVVGMVRYGDGYLMVGADGGIFNFSSLPFSGSLGDKPPASPVVAVAALPSA